MILLAVCLAVFMLLLDMTIVSSALADLQASLGADLSDLQWVIDAYALPMAGLLLTAATLGDRLVVASTCWAWPSSRRRRWSVRYRAVRPC